jgi:hypothetical protein
MPLAEAITFLATGFDAEPFFIVPQLDFAFITFSFFGFSLQLERS